MKAILLPIKKEYVGLILEGKKKFEYRKRLCKQDISRIIIYETAPTKLVVGEAIVEEMIVSSKDELWERTKQFSGTSKEFYDWYFKGRAKACAYRLSNPIRYDYPRALETYGIRGTVQSFVYVE